MKNIAVIIPAAGKAERFGGGEKKTLAKLDGRPVFLRTIEHFMNRDDVCQTILAVAPEDMESMKLSYGANLGFLGVKLIQGGVRRRDTVAEALKVVAEDATFVAIHDAARPCVSTEAIDAVFAEVTKTGAAILAAPITGTVKRVAGSNVIEETVTRNDLYEAQTPQVFRKDLLLAAYAGLADDAQVTDDAQVMEMAGHAVSVVISGASNIKITTKDDVVLASAILKARPVRKTPRFGAFEEAQW